MGARGRAIERELGYERITHVTVLLYFISSGTGVKQPGYFTKPICMQPLATMQPGLDPALTWHWLFWTCQDDSMSMTGKTDKSV